MAFTQPKMTCPYGASKKISVTPGAGSILANLQVNTSVTWAGVEQNSIVWAIAPSLETGLIIQNPCICTAGSVTLRIANVTVGTVTTAAQDIFFVKL